MTLVTFNVEDAILKKWKKNNKGKNKSEIISKHMESMNEEDAKLKNLRDPVNLGPLKTVLTISEKEGQHSTQLKLDKYFPFWFLDHKDYETRTKIFNSLSDDEVTQVMVAMNHQTKAFATLKRSKELGH